jgi:hypothetical protein
VIAGALFVFWARFDVVRFRGVGGPPQVRTSATGTQEKKVSGVRSGLSDIYLVNTKWVL